MWLLDMSNELDDSLTSSQDKMLSAQLTTCCVLVNLNIFPSQKQAVQALLPVPRVSSELLNTSLWTLNFC